MFFDQAWLVRTTTILRDLSLSDVGIGPANKNSQILTLQATGHSLMADFNVENVVAENASASGAELRVSEEIRTK